MLVDLRGLDIYGLTFNVGDYTMELRYYTTAWVYRYLLIFRNNRIRFIEGHFYLSYKYEEFLFNLIKTIPEDIKVATFLSLLNIIYNSQKLNYLLMLEKGWDIEKILNKLIVGLKISVVKTENEHDLRKINYIIDFAEENKIFSEETIKRMKRILSFDKVIATILANRVHRH
jgi:hypothetical protein